MGVRGAAELAGAVVQARRIRSGRHLVRHPQLLRREDCHVVVIDTQTKLLEAIGDRERILQRGSNFIAAARMMDIPITITQHYTRGLGPTHSRILSVAGDSTPIEKITFSCCACPQFNQSLQQRDRWQMVLMGLETHICVAQTALDLQHRGYQTYVVADATGSRKDFDRAAAVERMRQAGVIVTTTEAAAYELLERADTDLFKNALMLFK